MNKKELIEHYEDLSKKFHVFPVVAITRVLEDLQQLDKPQKVTIPQFVADWIEEGKKHCEDVSDLFDFDFTNEEVGNWFLQEKPFDLVARAWLDGYEVEKEKRYIVKVKGMEEGYDILNYRTSADKWFFSGEAEPLDYRTKHTRKQLEIGGFGEVFNNPLFEVEEVEE